MTKNVEEDMFQEQVVREGFQLMAVKPCEAPNASSKLEHIYGNTEIKRAQFTILEKGIRPQISRYQSKECQQQEQFVMHKMLQKNGKIMEFKTGDQRQINFKAHYELVFFYSINHTVFKITFFIRRIKSTKWLHKWYIDNFKPLKKMRGHPRTVSHFDFNQDGQYAMSNCSSYNILFFNVAEGKHNPSFTRSLKNEQYQVFVGYIPTFCSGSDINQLIDLQMLLYYQQLMTLILLHYLGIIASLKKHASSSLVAILLMLQIGQTNSMQQLKFDRVFSSFDAKEIQKKTDIIYQILLLGMFMIQRNHCNWQTRLLMQNQNGIAIFIWRIFTLEWQTLILSFKKKQTLHLLKEFPVKLVLHQQSAAIMFLYKKIFRVVTPQTVLQNFAGKQTTGVRSMDIQEYHNTFLVKAKDVEINMQTRARIKTLINIHFEDTKQIEFHGQTVHAKQFQKYSGQPKVEQFGCVKYQPFMKMIAYGTHSQLS
eukprot:403339117